MPTLNVSFTRTYTENESMYTVCKKWQKMDTRFYFNVKDKQPFGDLPQNKCF